MENSIYKYPIKVLLVFLIFTEVLFFIGPIAFVKKSPILLSAYFLIVNIALYAGFDLGIKKASTSSCKVSSSVIHVLLIAGLLLNIGYLRTSWATHGLSFSIENLLQALANPGDAYVGEAHSVVKVDIITGILLTPFRWACIPIGILEWKRLSPFFKMILVATFITYIITWLGIGTRKGLMDLILILFFLNIASNPSTLSSKKSKNQIRIFAFVSISLFLLFFIYSNLSRAGFSHSSELSDFQRHENKTFYINHCSPAFLSALSEITSYLSQGYEALSISLSDIGIIPVTFGGSSMQLWLYLDRFFGYNPIPDTYMFILQSRYGIDMYQCWHSFYLWIANDFTLIGVPFVIFLIGYYFARVWKDSLNRKNPWSYPVLAYMIIMVFYSFANNQVLSFSLESFIGCVLIYEFSRTLRFRRR